MLADAGLREHELHDLFARADKLAAALEKSLLTVVEDVAHAFRRLAKARYRRLSRQHARDLYGLWCELHVAELVAERDAVRASIAEAQAHLAKSLPRGGPFRCCCGEEGNPNDASWASVHQPHIQLASLDRPPAFVDAATVAANAARSTHIGRNPLNAFISTGRL